MKPEFNKKYNTIAAYVLIVAAILISYILHPADNILERRKKCDWFPYRSSESLFLRI